MVNVSTNSTANRDWRTQFECVDADTGNPIDFTGAAISIAVEDANGCQVLLATTANGMVTIVSVGIIELVVPYSKMNLCAGRYPMGGFYQLADETNDLFEGTLTLRKGIPKP